MRVLSIAFRTMAVGTSSGGGAEQILSILDHGLVERGHESYVVAAYGSRVAGELIGTPGESTSPDDHRRAIDLALSRYPVDLIHLHGLDFHEYVPDTLQPKLATLHLPISFYPAWIFDSSRRRFLMNCVSRSEADTAPVRLRVIPNGVYTSRYTPAAPDDFLLWLGRICPEKGVHIALEVAHRLNARLVVAGPVHPLPHHREYFAHCVEPLLDARRTYVGPVELDEKQSLLSHARCLLVPSLVAETSSLVSMEAISSGTPVIAFRSGALPEIVEDGETGFIVDNADAMAEAVGEVHRISRTFCRRRALKRFDSDQMVEAYLALYARMTTRHRATLRAPQSSL